MLFCQGELIMSKIIGTLEPVWSCRPEVKQACFELLSRHFQGVTWKQFNTDFHEKQYVALLRKSDRIVGFSTMTILPIFLSSGHVMNIAFSGDTIVEFEDRNTTELGKSLASFFREAISVHGDGNVWYVLISKGWRTYKALEFMFYCFAPHSHQKLSILEREVIVGFGKEKYPSRFNEKNLIIKALDGDQKLQPNSPDLKVPPSELGTFFIERNPGFADGDELVCVSRLSYDNFTERFKRCFR